MNEILSHMRQESVGPLEAPSSPRQVSGESQDLRLCLVRGKEAISPRPFGNFFRHLLYSEDLPSRLKAIQQRHGDVHDDFGMKLEPHVDCFVPDLRLAHNFNVLLDDVVVLASVPAIPVSVMVRSWTPLSHINTAAPQAQS